MDDRQERKRPVSLASKTRHCLARRWNTRCCKIRNDVTLKRREEEWKDSKFTLSENISYTMKHIFLA